MLFSTIAQQTRRSVLTSTRQFSATALRASDVARLTLVGRIGGDLAVQTAASGREYLRYPIAVNYKTAVSWFNVTVFDENAINFMTQYVKKGNIVYVEANASIQNYETSDGKKIPTISLVQRSITKIAGRNEEEVEEGTETAEA